MFWGKIVTLQIVRSVTYMFSLNFQKNRDLTSLQVRYPYFFKTNYEKPWPYKLPGPLPIYFSKFYEKSWPYKFHVRGTYFFRFFLWKNRDLTSVHVRYVYVFPKFYEKTWPYKYPGPKGSLGLTWSNKIFGILLGGMLAPILAPLWSRSWDLVRAKLA